MKTELYTIETLSNLHVGAGDINFGVIDNQVQRDSVTNLPNINSSSLKGAFREHFSEDNVETSNMVKFIFGQENNSSDTQAGAYNFFEAQLLTRPVRSSVKAYFSATSPSVIKNFLEAVESFNIAFDDGLKKVLKELSELKPKKDTPLVFENIKNTILEDEKAEYKNFDTSKLKELLGEDIALFEDSTFKELDLPVLARNALENGVSKNLWYEEVVPKKSKFFFFIGKPDNLDSADKKEKLDKFERSFDGADIVQFGANKSIGYGFSRVTKVSL